MSLYCASLNNPLTREIFEGETRTPRVAESFHRLKKGFEGYVLAEVKFRKPSAWGEDLPSGRESSVP